VRGAVPGNQRKTCRVSLTDPVQKHADVDFPATDQDNCYPVGRRSNRRWLRNPEFPYDHWTMGMFSLDMWRRVLRETGFEVHEGRYSAGDDEYTTFACVKTV